MDLNKLGVMLFIAVLTVLFYIKHATSYVWMDNKQYALLGLMQNSVNGQTIFVPIYQEVRK